MYYSCLYHTLGSLPRGYTGYIYIIVGLSALLVPTIRAMREPLYSGTSGRTGSTFFICVCTINHLINRHSWSRRQQTIYTIMNTFTKRACLSAICMVLVAVCHAATIETCIDGIYYKLNTSNNTASVTYSPTSGVYYSGAVVIPVSVTVDGTEYSVTSIGRKAFNKCTELTSVTIPNSIVSIEHTAFDRCSKLTSINIPNSVKSIGNYAFRGCSELASVTIGEGVTSIDYYAFSGCSGLTSINIPNNVTSIGENAFSGCSGLTAVTIGEGVTSLPIQIFGNCTGLKSINLHDKITSVSKTAFQGCTGLTQITVSKNNTKYDSREDCNAIIETATNKVIKGCPSTIIPSTVTAIGEDAFASYSWSQPITIPNSVTSIEHGAFEGSKGLKSITIPSSVTSISGNPFYNCTGLVSITVSPDNTVFDSRENCNAIIETATNRLLSGCQTTAIPPTITSIDNEAFLMCSQLTSITIPANVTSIGNNTFWGCTRLTSITSLATTPPVCGTAVFDLINKNVCTLYVPEGTVDLYKAADQWKDFLNISGIATSIKGVNDDTGRPDVTGYYNSNGCNLNKPVRGLNIIRYADGTVRKVITK